jgi:hypothetical protein
LFIDLKESTLLCLLCRPALISSEPASPLTMYRRGAGEDIIIYLQSLLEDVVTMLLFPFRQLFRIFH